MECGRASDSESRVPGFDPHRCHRVVSLSKTHQLPTVLVKDLCVVTVDTCLKIYLYKKHCLFLSKMLHS